jgi:phage replication O-like protein O
MARQPRKEWYFKGFEDPNYTETPNAFYDLLPQFESLSELKVVLAVIRKTFGWHKQEDLISLTQLEELTGLSRQGVIDGVKLGIQHGLLVRREANVDGNEGYFYGLNLVNNIDYSKKNQSILLTTTSQQNGLPLVNNIDTQKKPLNKGKESARPISFFEERISGLIVTYGELKVGAARRIANNKQKGDNLTFIERCIDNLTEKEMEDYKKSVAQAQPKIINPEFEERKKKILAERLGR